MTLNSSPCGKETAGQPLSPASNADASEKFGHFGLNFWKAFEYYAMYLQFRLNSNFSRGCFSSFFLLHGEMVPSKIALCSCFTSRLTSACPPLHINHRVTLHLNDTYNEEYSSFGEEYSNSKPGFGLGRTLHGSSTTRIWILTSTNESVPVGIAAVETEETMSKTTPPIVKYGAQLYTLWNVQSMRVGTK